MPATRVPLTISVRIRPVPESEQAQLQHRGGTDKDPANGLVEPRGKIIQLLDTEKQHLSEFSVDNVFGVQSTTTDVFQTIAEPLLDHVLSGYNSCVFAYGQTSSGKTHNMLGSQVCFSLRVCCIPSNMFVSEERSSVLMHHMFRRLMIRVRQRALYHCALTNYSVP
jgi:hypothetical protein